MMNLVDLNAVKGSREQAELFDGDDIIAEILAGYDVGEDEDVLEFEPHMLLSDQQLLALTDCEGQDFDVVFEHCLKITEQLGDRLKRLKYYLDELEHNI